MEVDEATGHLPAGRLDRPQAQGKNRFGRIGVLMGGPSSEREISLKSGKAVFHALVQAECEAVAIDLKNENTQEVRDLIVSQGIQCAFIALHGRFGEDGQIQEILENLKIPYTGSGVAASRLAMDKAASLFLFEKAGLLIPRFTILEKSPVRQHIELPFGLGFPLVVKPSSHGSSIGLSIARSLEEFNKAARLAFRYDERILVEEYIKGRELTVGILENQALPVIEILTSREFFDFEAKYQSGFTQYIVPAQLEKEQVDRVQSAALTAHAVLGCSGCSRVDFILRDDADAFILEINTIPGFTDTSLLPKAAKSIGINFQQLCVRLLALAYEKNQY